MNPLAPLAGNTGGQCHTDAGTLDAALDAGPVEQKDVGFRAKWANIQREYSAELPPTG